MPTLLFCLFVALVAFTLQLFGYEPSNSLFLFAVCPTTVDRLRMRTEFLGPTLHHIASYMDPWLNIVPRDTWEPGVGLVRSTFTIGRSAPTSDEEVWDPIVVTSGETYIGSCGENYAAVDIGYGERLFSPESKGLHGPLQCVDDFTLNWNSTGFWSAYMTKLQQRTQLTFIGRVANIYMNLVPKAAANTDFHFIDGNTDQVPPSAVDLGDLDIADCALTQDMLDATARELTYAGATVPDSAGWITWGEEGPLYPILIGADASASIARAQAEFRQDVRHAFEGDGNAALLLKRWGASLMIKNFRHMITLTPPRWKIVGGAYVRVNTYSSQTMAGGKGTVQIFNPDWVDPTIATHEGAIVMNPGVYTERILQPETSIPGMTWQPQNYFGEWKFVTGPEAVLGFDDCAGIAGGDPFHTRGRHFARYRHAAEPVHPEYGRLVVFKRCPSVWECISCASAS